MPKTGESQWHMRPNKTERQYAQIEKEALAVTCMGLREIVLATSWAV